MDITYIEVDTNVDNYYNKILANINPLLVDHVPIKSCRIKKSKFKFNP